MPAASLPAWVPIRAWRALAADQVTVEDGLLKAVFETYLAGTRNEPVHALRDWRDPMSSKEFAPRSTLEDPCSVGWIYDWHGERRALSVYAIQMQEPFALHVCRGVMHGERGDYLMRYSTGAWDLWARSSFERNWRLRCG